MNKVQIFIIIVSIILAIGAVFVFTSGTSKNNQASTGQLTVWGILPNDSLKPTFQEYSRETKTTISYVEISERDFTERLLKAIATDTGPDVVIQRADWIKSNRSILSPVPSTVISVRDYQNTFVDIAPAIFVEGNSIWAFPMSIDPLVLYWNKDIFNSASVPLPPKDWDEVLTISNQLKKIGDGGVIERAGIALGRARNIPIVKDILSLLLLQLGGDIEDSAGKFLFDKQSGADQIGDQILKFYTDFSRSGTEAYTWNINLPEPRDLFLQGKLGMMIDFISYSPTIKLKSPHISYDIARPPQVAHAEFPIYYASAEGVVVPRRSKNGLAGWSFARWLTSPTAVKIHLKSRSVGPARRDLLNDTELAKNNLLPLLRELTLNSRGVHDIYSDDNAQLIREMVEGVADDRVTPAFVISNARIKSQATRGTK